MAIGGGLGWVKWLKNGLDQGFVSHAIISALYRSWLKILLVKLKNLYIQHARVLIMEKRNGNQKDEGWKGNEIC